MIWIILAIALGAIVIGAFGFFSWVSIQLCIADRRDEQ